MITLIPRWWGTLCLMYVSLGMGARIQWEIKSTWWNFPWCWRARYCYPQVYVQKLTANGFQNLFDEMLLNILFSCIDFFISVSCTETSDGSWLNVDFVQIRTKKACALSAFEKNKTLNEFFFHLKSETSILFTMSPNLEKWICIHKAGNNANVLLSIASFRSKSNHWKNLQRDSIN